MVCSPVHNSCSTERKKRKKIHCQINKYIMKNFSSWAHAELLLLFPGSKRSRGKTSMDETWYHHHSLLALTVVFLHMESTADSSVTAIWTRHCYLNTPEVFITFTVIRISTSHYCTSLRKICNFHLNQHDYRVSSICRLLLPYRQGMGDKYAHPYSCTQIKLFN